MMNPLKIIKKKKFSVLVLCDDESWNKLVLLGQNCSAVKQINARANRK